MRIAEAMRVTATDRILEIQDGALALRWIKAGTGLTRRARSDIDEMKVRRICMLLRGLIWLAMAPCCEEADSTGIAPTSCPRTRFQK